MKLQLSQGEILDPEQSLPGPASGPPGSTPATKTTLVNYLDTAENPAVDPVKNSSLCGLPMYYSC